MTPRRAVPALVLLVLLAHGTRARAANPEQAQKLFVEAMDLLKKKQYADACDKLARSLELDPGMGTQFRLAECYEKLGRTASAFTQYTAVAEAAKAANKPDREAVARRRATALEPKVARLTIVIPPSVAALPGVEVIRDGAAVDRPLWGTPVPVDPGDHVVTVRAAGRKPWEGKVWAESGAKLSVAIAALEEERRAPPPPPRKSMVPVIALGAGGGLGVVLGAVFVGVRSAKMGSASSLHDAISKAGGTCLYGGGTQFGAQCSALHGAASAGDHLGTASIVSFTMGGVALAAMGAYLLLPASALPWARPARSGDADRPRSASPGASFPPAGWLASVQFSPAVGPSGLLLSASGAF
jgi:hypothetical protein